MRFADTRFIYTIYIHTCVYLSFFSKRVSRRRNLHLFLFFFFFFFCFFFISNGVTLQKSRAYALARTIFLVKWNPWRSLLNDIDLSKSKPFNAQTRRNGTILTSLFLSLLFSITPSPFHILVFLFFFFTTVYRTYCTYRWYFFRNVV